MSARSRVIATISLLTLVLVAGACGGDGRSTEGQVTQPPAPGAGGTTAPNQQPAPPLPPRSVSVAGPRLDNTTPDLSCVVVRNTEADVAVKIVGVTFTNVGDQVVREDTHCPATNGVEAMPTRSCAEGVTLPASESYTDGCRVGAAPKVEGAPWNHEPAVVTLTLQAVCTNTTGVPCNQLTGTNAPAAGTTVLATWTPEAVGLGLQPGSYLEPENG